MRSLKIFIHSCWPSFTVAAPSFMVKVCAYVGAAITIAAAAASPRNTCLFIFVASLSRDLSVACNHLVDQPARLQRRGVAHDVDLRPVADPRVGRRLRLQQIHILG